MREASGGKTAAQHEKSHDQCRARSNQEGCQKRDDCYGEGYYERVHRLAQTARSAQIPMKTMKRAKAASATNTAWLLQRKLRHIPRATLDIRQVTLTADIRA